MCVITVVHDSHKRPNENEIQAMWDQNDHGGGAAWFEGKTLKWEKGIMQVGTMQELAETLPVPYVLHFRLNSVGGVHAALTHPFPITPEVPLSLVGETTKFPVLFHNGTWGQWRKDTLFMAQGKGYSIPRGRWSDSRAMALIAAHYDIGVLEMLDEKIVVLDPRQTGSTRVAIIGSGFEVYEKRFVVSNKFWEHKSKNYISEAERWLRERAGGDKKNGKVLDLVPSTPERTAPVLVDDGLDKNKVGNPVKQLTGGTATTPAINGGGPAAVGPFVQPLTFYEHRFAQGLITSKGMTKIRKYFNRIERNPTGQSTKPKAMLEIEEKHQTTH